MARPEKGPVPLFPPEPHLLSVRRNTLSLLCSHSGEYPLDLRPSIARVTELWDSSVKKNLSQHVLTLPP